MKIISSCGFHWASDGFVSCLSYSHCKSDSFAMCFYIRAPRSFYFTRVRIATMDFTMCFWHSSSQNAVFCGSKNRNCALHHVFLTLRCTECERVRSKSTPRTGGNTQWWGGRRGFWLGGTCGEPRELIPRILENLKKYIGGSNGGLKDQTRHWRLEGFMD